MLLHFSLVWGKGNWKLDSEVVEKGGWGGGVGRISAAFSHFLKLKEPKNLIDKYHHHHHHHHHVHEGLGAFPVPSDSRWSWSLLSSSVVLCSFVLLIYIVTLVLVSYLCPSSVRVVATFSGTVLFLYYILCSRFSPNT